MVAYNSEVTATHVLPFVYIGFFVGVLYHLYANNKAVVASAVIVGNYKLATADDNSDFYLYGKKEGKDNYYGDVALLKSTACRCAGGKCLRDISLLVNSIRTPISGCELDAACTDTAVRPGYSLECDRRLQNRSGFKG